MRRRVVGGAAFVTETGEAVPGEPNSSYANMLRNGFRVVYSRPNYVRARPPA